MRDGNYIKEKKIKLGNDGKDALKLQLQRHSTPGKGPIMWLESFEDDEGHALLDVSPTEARHIAKYLLVFADEAERLGR